MAAALVACGAISTGASPVTPAFGAATTAGNLLIARVVTTGFAASTTATGWNLIASGNASAGGSWSGIFIKENCGASETAPTFTNASGTIWADLQEVSGISSPATDVTNHTGDVVTFVNNNGVADASPGEYVTSVAGVVGTKSATWTFTNTWSPSGSVVTAATQDSGAAKNAVAATMSSYITTSNASADSNTTGVTPSTGSTSSWGACIASFKVGPAVGVSSISPTSGIPGDTVAVTGTLFTGATDVTFGGVSASSFTVNSDTSITATAPAGVGVVDVQVHLSGSVSPANSGDKFTYLPNARPVVILNQAINRASRW